MSRGVIVKYLKGEGFEYVLKYTRRKTVGIFVHVDGRVEVRAPPRYPQYLVKDFVASRTAWVNKQLLRSSPSPLSPEPDYMDGERHPLLGDYLTLRVEPGLFDIVEPIKGDLVVTTRTPDAEFIKHAVTTWYKAQAQSLLEERVSYWWERMDWLRHFPRPNIKVRSMRTRWGSCSSRGSINFNIELIKKPLDCVDYIVVHELCHLREFNHSDAFYRLMSAALPDWEDRQTLLEQPVSL